MTDREALLKAIQADPEDDTARLVYSDWLEENSATDQDAARVEWIRMTCFKSVKARSNGIRHRHPGEPDWLRKNAPRLWPHLNSLRQDGNRGYWQMQLGKIVLGVDVSTGRRVIDHVPSVIVIRAERGVAKYIACTFLRAAQIAPYAAADEPFASIRLASAPQRAVDVDQYNQSGLGRVARVYHRAFEMRGLEAVWWGLGGFVGEPVSGYGLARCYCRSYPENELETVVAMRSIGVSLTRWARQQYEFLYGDHALTPASASQPATAES